MGGEQLVEEGIEHGVFANDNLDNLALGVDDHLGGETLDALGGEQFGFAWIIDMLPRQLVLGHGLFPLLVGISTVDAQTFHPVSIFFIILLHLGHTLDAPSTP